MVASPIVPGEQWTFLSKGQVEKEAEVVIMTLVELNDSTDCWQPVTHLGSKQQQQEIPALIGMMAGLIY